MKTSSKIGLAVALILLLVGGFLWWGGQSAPKSANQLIVTTLRDAEDAARRGSTSGVMDTISDDFQAGPLNKPRLRIMLARTLRQAHGVDYDVSVNQPKIAPSPLGKPDERMVVTRFAAFYTGTGENIYRTPVTLIMRQETRRKWLVFREPYWRIVGVVGAVPLPGSDSSGEGIL